MNSMIQRNQWVVWKLEKVEGRDKPTKIPYSALTGKHASSTDSSTWVDHATAVTMAQMMGANGLGYVLSDADPYVFIDIDNCLVDPGLPTARWSDFALSVLRLFPGAYVEVSQSKNGLHIFCSVTSIPENFRSLNDQKLGLEIYYHWRFAAMTMTGSGSAMTDCTAGFYQLVALYGKTEEAVDLSNWTTTANSEWEGPEDDDELIRRACESKSAGNTFGGKASFRDLWERNVTALAKTYPHESKEYDYSTADAALCSHLAFWTGKNCERMERLFNRSAIVRGKWTDRQGYRQTTILGSAAKCSVVYKQKPALTPELIASVQSAPTVTLPVGQAPAYMNVTPGGNYRDNHSTNAATFAVNFYPSNTLMFVAKQGYRYNNKCWERVEEEELKHQLTMAMLTSEPKADVINGTFKVLSYMFTRSKMKLGKWEGRDTSQLINCQNGILDIATGRLEPHNPKFFTTGVLPYGYDADAHAPQWGNFLKETLENDIERINLLQEWLGYMLVTTYEFQKAMLLIGAPRSGKGTIGRILRELVGEESYQGISLGGLADDPILENISDKSVLFIGDAHSISGNDRNRVLERFKSITGADEISFNRKYKGAWSGRLPGRVTMAANNVPQFADDSGAMANRLLILSFNLSFLGREDPYLTEKLLTELPGICNWALQGLARLRAVGRFTEPEASREERNEIMVQQAPLMGFINERCDVGLQHREGSEAIYNAYKMWRTAEGGNAMTRTVFNRALRSTLRGHIEKKSTRLGTDDKTVQAWHGIKLKDGMQGMPNNVLPFAANNS